MHFIKKKERIDYKPGTENHDKWRINALWGHHVAASSGADHTVPWGVTIYKPVYTPNQVNAATKSHEHF